jgi:hypothetical protein
MGTKTKVALAGTFVGLVAMSAAAFGQTGADPGSDTPTPRAKRTATAERRAAAAERRANGRCPTLDGRRAQRLVHNESKVKAPAGFANITVDQGTITALDGKKVTIKRLDGESVSATATDQTKVCKDGKVSTLDALKKGDHARLVQVRSERFTGLRRIAAVSPGSESSAPPASPADFSGDDLGDLVTA